MTSKAILRYFDTDLYDELQARETEERKDYQKTLKEFVMKMKLEKEE